MKRILLLYIGLVCLVWAVQGQEKLLKLNEDSFLSFGEKVASSSYKNDEAQKALFEKKCKEVFDSYVKKNQMKWTEQDYRDAQDTIMRLTHEMKKQENVIKRLQKDSASRADDKQTKDKLFSEQKQWRKDSIELQCRLAALSELKKREQSDSMLLATKEDAVNALNLENHLCIQVRDSLQNLCEQQKKDLAKFQYAVDKVEGKMEKAWEESRDSSLLSLNAEKLQAEGSGYQNIRSFISGVDIQLDKELSDKSQQLLKVAEISAVARKAVEGMKEPYNSKKNEDMQTEMSKMSKSMLACLTSEQEEEYNRIVEAVQEQYRSYKNIIGIINDLKEKKCIPTEEKAKKALEDIRGYLSFVTDGETYDAYYVIFNDVLQKLVDTLKSRSMDMPSDEVKFISFLEELKAEL